MNTTAIFRLNIHLSFHPFILPSIHRPTHRSIHPFTTALYHRRQEDSDNVKGQEQTFAATAAFAAAAAAVAVSPALMARRRRRRRRNRGHVVPARGEQGLRVSINISESIHQRQ